MIDSDYGDDANLSADEDQIRKNISVIVELSQELARKEELKDDLKKEIEKLDAEIANLSQYLIPTMMKLLGLKQLTTTDGQIIEIKEDVRATQPKEGDERRPKLFHWLRNNNFGGLIKNQIHIELSKGEDDAANSIVEILKIYDSQLPVERTEGLNHQTMLAFLRERKREGQIVPLELFGAYWQEFTKIKQPKK